MMKQRYALTGCLILLVAFLQCGCEIATIEEPVGEPWSLKETKAIEGQWLAPNGDPLELVVVSKGDVRGGSLNWDSKKMEFVATTERYQFRHVGKFDIVFSDVPDQAATIEDNCVTRLIYHLPNGGKRTRLVDSVAMRFPDTFLSLP